MLATGRGMHYINKNCITQVNVELNTEVKLNTQFMFYNEIRLKQELDLMKHFFASVSLQN